jgi:hypothetical protein
LTMYQIKLTPLQINYSYNNNLIAPTFKSGVKKRKEQLGFSPN